MEKNAQYVMLELMSMDFVLVVLVAIDFSDHWQDYYH